MAINSCKRENECKVIKVRGDGGKSGKSFWCDNCGYKHMDGVSHRKQPAIKELKDGFFGLCPNRKKSRVRLSFDKPFRGLFCKRFPNLVPLSKTELTRQVRINGGEVKIKFKCDGAFRNKSLKGVKQHYIFYELKHAGLDTNQILSAILSAQLVSELLPHDKGCLKYFYFGSWGGGGIGRDDFFNENSTTIMPAVLWAESKGFIKFYGILDIEDMFNEIKAFFK